MKKQLYILLVLLMAFSSIIISQSAFDKKWITHFEKTEFKGSPDYQKTMEYFQMFADDCENAEMQTFGISPQGREMKCLIINSDKVFTPEEAKRSNKPVVLLQNGIHAGEIEGKEASMLLLREILVTKEKADLLNNVIFIVIPIFNVDGHERRSPFGRINQNGPEIMGWRVTAQNLNLNRDYMKADTPEMRAMLNLYNTWLPDIYIDSHTTDGADYQYTLTYIVDKNQNLPPATRKWAREKFIPAIVEGAEKEGFLIFPYVAFNKVLEGGIYEFVSSPRFSTGFASAQNRPEVTIETHMLKPYKERVFSTKAVIEGILNLANSNPEELVQLNREADKSVIKKYAVEKNYFPIQFDTAEDFELIDFKGFKKQIVYSEVMGSAVEKYSAENYDMQIPLFTETYIKDSVSLPDLYLIPRECTDVIEVIKAHRIEFEILDNDTEFEVERYKFKDVKFASFPYEGRFVPEFNYDVYEEKIIVPAGTIIINTRQRRIGLIAYLLEPKSKDSFVKWGFFNKIFERKEYFESYSMEPIAAEMFKENEDLRDEFLKKIKTDSKFKDSPRERLNFFYEKTNYYDRNHNTYPVMRVIN